MDPVTLDILILVSIFLIGPICFLMGRILDLNWRCKRMRQFMKKDFRLMKFKFKGSKTLFSRIVDVTSGVIVIGAQHWVMAGDRMYREDSEKVGLNIKKLDKDPSYDDGCPVIYVDADNFTPLEFQGDNTTVRPDEVGATYSGYLLNQMMKALSFVKNIRTMLMLCVLLGAVCCMLSYMNHVDVAAVKLAQDKEQSQLDNLTLLIHPNIIPQQTSPPSGVTNG
jgi:hypothetical protein